MTCGAHGSFNTHAKSLFSILNIKLQQFTQTLFQVKYSRIKARSKPKFQQNSMKFVEFSKNQIIDQIFLIILFFKKSTILNCSAIARKNGNDSF